MSAEDQQVHTVNIKGTAVGSSTVPPHLALSRDPEKRRRKRRKTSKIKASLAEW